MKKNNKTKLSFKEIILSWKSWAIILGILMIFTFVSIENIISKTQPSKEWSMGIEIAKDIPSDFRKFGQTNRPDNKGIAVAYVVEEGIMIHELDWFGNIEKSTMIERDTFKTRVVNIEVDEGIYHIYLSDRLVLDRLDVDISTLTLKDEKRISNTSEQFDSVGNTVIVGNNDITEIIIDDEVVATFKDYEDIKRVQITRKDGKIFATLSTVKGERVIVVDGDKILEKEIMNSVDQSTYGYLKDIYVDNGIITVISHKYHITSNKPSALGVWQLDENTLDEKLFEIWYHVATRLEPKITNVSGGEITYILGNLQEQSTVNGGLMSHPRNQKGTFTNISHYTRENKKLIGNTRLTLTRQYPIGYEYFENGKSSVVLWGDRGGTYSRLMISGKGEEWINRAKGLHKMDYESVIMEAVMAFVSAIFYGFIILSLNITLYWKSILLFFIATIVYKKWAPFDIDKKKIHVILASVAFVIGFKFYITAIANLDLKYYAHIYPMLLGNDIVLGIMSLLTSAFSIAVSILWYRKHNYMKRIAQFGVFVAFEVYFYLFTTVVYMVAGMMKNSSLL